MKKSASLILALALLAAPGFAKDKHKDKKEKKHKLVFHPTDIQKIQYDPATCKQQPDGRQKCEAYITLKTVNVERDTN